MQGFKTILALDTAMNGCGVAVVGKSVSVSKAMSMTRGQAEHLLPLVEDVLAEAGLGYEALDGIVTTVGPGAFTGLRIGLSAARSLALALSIPVYGMTTLQALALEHVQKHDMDGQALAVIIETKREDFYVQIFDCEARPLSDARAVSAEEARLMLESYAVRILIGDALVRFRGMLGGDALRGYEEAAYDLANTEVMARALIEGRTDMLEAGPSPVYLRGADVSRSKRPQRVLERKS